MADLPRLLVATTNAGKLREYQDMLAGLPVRWVGLDDVGLAGVDVEETGTTFWQNALIKALDYARRANLPTLADDSGLEVDALNGRPGVYTARYAPTVAERNAKLLKALKGAPDEARGARFVCVTALATPDGLTVTAEGTLDGRIGHAPRGVHGFGYDPIFMLPDGRALAELPPDEKHAISHRGRALARIRPLLEYVLAHPPMR
ncbi:MAG: RdgB/HAM1 family non-canonical purine NTP pyrophosphatase [Anaerolineae bacterium]|nr:RdgB/HAM1 family non-canonical purine NTP pyrophosphatase [Anaerolineae bacterium]